MEAELVGHVCHLVLLICLLGDDSHRSLGLVLLWEGVASLSEIAAKNLHDAVRVSVVVDGASLSWGPDEYKLVGFLSIHWMHLDG